MYKLSKWFATTSQVWGNGARICRAIGRRPTDWSKNKERLLKNIAEVETIAREFGVEVLVSEKGENKSEGGVMWRYFSDEMPELYKKVRVDTTEEIIETETYKHSGKLMLKCVDGNEHFIRFSPMLLNEKAKWHYANQ